MRLRSTSAVVAVAVTLGASLAASAASAEASPQAAPSLVASPRVAAPHTAGGYHQLEPQRVLDTRAGNGVPVGKVGPGGTISFPVLGRAGVPASVRAVVLNVTVVSPTTATYVTVFPSGTTQPNVSSINVPPGMTRANLVTVPVGTDGRVSLFNSGGVVDLLADVAGYYDTDGSGGGAIPLPETRVFDSRDPQYGGPLALAPGESVDIPVDISADANAHVTALAVNLTAINTRGPGWVTAWNGATAPPNASALNFNASDIVPNMAIVPVRQENFGGTIYPTITVGNFAAGDIDLAVDLVAFYGDGSFSKDLRFQPLPLTRTLDTRSGYGGITRLGAGETKRAVAPADLVDAQTYGLVSNLTAVSPSTSTYLTFWYAGESQPGTSNLNAGPGQTVANAGYIDPDTKIYNASGSTDVLIDVSGRFEVNGSAPTSGLSRVAAQAGVSGFSKPVPHAVTHTWDRFQTH